jgi:hypothetical protein
MHTTALTRSDVERAVVGLTLPDGITAEVLSVTISATRSEVLVVALWSRAHRACPGCGQTERPVDRDCPITLDGSRGEVQPRSQQHGCGAWWGPLAWDAVTVARHDDTVDDVTAKVYAAAFEMAADMGDVLAARSEALADHLTDLTLVERDELWATGRIPGLPGVEVDWDAVDALRRHLDEASPADVVVTFDGAAAVWQGGLGRWVPVPVEDRP